MDPVKLSYSQWQIEHLFKQSGPFIHLYTTPAESWTIIDNDEDRTFMLNQIAIASRRVKISVLAYALMSNHIHLILQCNEDGGNAFFNEIGAPLNRYLSSRGKKKYFKDDGYGITPITSIKQFRNEVAYVIRNPFVVRDDINLLAYQWCSGYLYFNPMLSLDAGKPMSSITYREKRRIAKCRDVNLPENLRVDNGLIQPQSFVDFHLAEKLFTSARQFLFAALKNVEAQIEVAKSHGEILRLSDDEMFVQSRRICESLFGVKSPDQLGSSQKKSLSMELRNNFHASNGQIARFSGLSPAEVNTLYPLTPKTSSPK